MKMNRIIKYLLLGLVFFSISCNNDDEEYSLGTAPTPADAEFTFSVSAQGPNYISFSNTNPDAFLKVWEFGNGTTSKADSPTAYYPFAGEYTVTLTIYTKGGSASSVQMVTVTQTDPEICNVERLKMLTGGCNAANGKTWVIDKDRKGHFGVGPVTETFPIWYEAGANEKAGGGMYDDEYTFFLAESKFVQKTNGDIFINTAQAANFPGASPSVGDFIAPFTASDNINYALSEDADGNLFISFSNGGFIGYYTGVTTFQVISLTNDEMFIKFKDAANGDLAWFHRLIRKGYIPDVVLPETATLPINFEGDPIPFGGFGGSSFEQIDNPDASGINTSAKVGMTVKGVETWAGISVPLSANIDFSVNNAFKMSVWSPVAGIAKLKFENKDDANVNMEVDVNITKTNQWEELVFDFTGAPSDTYGVMAIFFDFGNPGNDQVFYFDDVRQSQTQASTLNINFEDGTPEFVPFGNSAIAIIDNPDASGANTSGKVAEFVKNGGSETWAGASTDIPFFLDFSVNNLVKIKTWSPKANAVVKFKIENQANANINVEIDQTTTVANQWEELTFDLTGLPADTYNRVVVFMDFGVTGDATYYFDDIMQVPGEGSGPTGAALPINFESADIAFEGFGGSSYEQIDNPDASGVNTSAKVGKTIKGFEPWAGITTPLEADVNFSTNNAFSLKVWSPVAGIAKLKLENRLDAGNAMEVDVNITKTNEWEELVFDFTGAPSGTYGRMALFFDFGNPGNDQVFYFDDIMQTSTSGGGGGGGGGTPGEMNIDFDTNAPTFTAFEGGAFALINNPDASGINTSAKVGEFIKTTASQPWAGVETVLPSALNFSTKNLIKVKVWSPNAGTVVRFKIEKSTDPTVYIELDRTMTSTNTWEELTWDFTGGAAGTYDKVAFFIDFGVNVDATYYFDDMVQAAGTTGGGGGGGNAVNLSINFDDGTPEFTPFGNGAFAIVDNPDTNGNTSAKVAQFTKTATSETWAGCSYDMGGTLDFGTKKTVKIKVWSPKAGAAFLFKIENQNASEVLEISKSTTGANQWEELTYDLTGVAANKFVRIVVFPDFGANGDAVYYFDDIRQE